MRKMYPLRHIMYKTPVVVVWEHSLSNILDTQTCVGVLAETRSLQLCCLWLLSQQQNNQSHLDSGSLIFISDFVRYHLGLYLWWRFFYWFFFIMQDGAKYLDLLENGSKFTMQSWQLRLGGLFANLPVVEVTIGSEHYSGIRVGTSGRFVSQCNDPNIFLGLTLNGVWWAQQCDIPSNPLTRAKQISIPFVQAKNLFETIGISANWKF